MAGKRNLRWLAAPGLGAIVVLSAGIWLLQSHHASALTERDTILLTDFRNTTGDAVFDDTPKQALATDLEQLPFLTVFPEQRVQHTLKLMGRAADARVTSALIPHISLTCADFTFFVDSN